MAGFAQVHVRVGPATVRLAAVPSVHPQSVLAAPPFGTVSARTHDGPVAFRATLEDVDVPALQRMIEGGGADRPPVGLRPTLAPLESAARAAARTLVLRTLILGPLAGVAAVLLFRRRTLRKALVAAAGGLAVVSLMLAPAAVTFDVGAFRTPTYAGALEYAPALVGDARTGMARLRTLREEMARISENLDRAYSALGQPVPDDGGDTIRILHVSDLHLNPAGADLTRRLAAQFGVAAVVDSGDSGTWGLPFEPGFAQRFADYPVPYVWVRGNHDSAGMVAAMRASGVRVLDDEATDVAGIRMLGLANPGFSPGHGADHAVLDAALRDRGEEVARGLDRRAEAVDVLLVHDPVLAAAGYGRVATILDGHLHRFGTALRGGTRELTDGSTGAAGPDGLRAPVTMSYEAQVLYFDPVTHRPVAADRVEVARLGSSFTVERHVLAEGSTAFVADPLPLREDLAVGPPRHAARLPSR